MLESLAGKVGANEATAIKEFLVEQLKTDSAATIGYPDTGSVRNTPPSPPSSGSGSGNACESRSVPSGPSCWDKSTFGYAAVGVVGVATAVVAAVAAVAAVDVVAHVVGVVRGRKMGGVMVCPAISYAPSHRSRS